MKSLSSVQPFATLWTVAYQDPLSTGFSRQEARGGARDCHLGESLRRQRHCLSFPVVTPRGPDARGTIITATLACTGHTRTYVYGKRNIDDSIQDNKPRGKQGLEDKNLTEVTGIAGRV